MSKILQVVHKGYAQNAKATVVSPASAEQLRVYSVKLHNRSGGAIDVGFLRKFTSAGFKVYSQVAAGTCTEVSTAIQAGTATTIINTVNNNGFVVQSKDLFSLIAFNVSQAQGGAPVYAYQYYNGTSFTTLSTITVPASYALGTQIVMFNAPSDWVKGYTGITGVEDNKYTMRLISTTAPTTAVQANEVWSGQLYDFQEGLADNGTLVAEYPETAPLLLEGNEGIMPYFGGVATVQNQVRVVYESKD